VDKAFDEAPIRLAKQIPGTTNTPDDAVPGPAFFIKWLHSDELEKLFK
jgi:hypothetical protein